jgi:hypothetical protein
MRRSPFRRLRSHSERRRLLTLSSIRLRILRQHSIFWLGLVCITLPVNSFTAAAESLPNTIPVGEPVESIEIVPEEAVTGV